MARRKIIFENNNYYHIYNRGIDKRNIISGENDILRLLQSLTLFNTTESIGSIYEYSRKFGKKFRSPGPKLIEIVAFNILDNHYHLVIKQLRDGGISNFMRDFGAGYTKYFNEKNSRVGSLFQGPFKAKHINSDEYLNYVVAYVNTNNIIHKMTSSKKFEVDSKWGMRSSLEQYISDKNKWKNKYFKCDISMVRDRFKSAEEYFNDAKGIAQNIAERRNEDIII